MPHGQRWQRCSGETEVHARARERDLPNPLSPLIATRATWARPGGCEKSSSGCAAFRGLLDVRAMGCSGVVGAAAALRAAGSRALFVARDLVGR